MQEINPNSSFAARLATALSLYWRLLIGVIVLAVSASVAIAFLMAPKYECTMKILLKNDQVNLPLGSDEHALSFVYQAHPDQARVSSEIALLTSADLLRRVVEAVHLDALERSSRNPKSDALRKLRKHLSAKSIENSSLIEVSYWSPDPKQALDVVRSLSLLYLEYHARLHSTPGTVELFDRQIEAYQKDLDQAENALSSFRKDNQIVSLAEEKRLVVAQIYNLQEQAAKNDSIQQAQARQIDALEAQIAGLEPKAVKLNRSTKQSLEQLVVTWIELRNRRASLLSKSQPNRRQLVSVNHQIVAGEKALLQASSLDVFALGNESDPALRSPYAELRKALVTFAGTTMLTMKLDGQIAFHRSRLNHLEKVSTVHDSLLRRVKEVQDARASFVQKREDSRTGALLDRRYSSDLTVAEQPFLPDAPSSPNPLFFILIGSLLGVFLDAVLLTCLAKRSLNLLSAADFEQLLNMPVLATVPDGLQQPISLRTALLPGESR